MKDNANSTRWWKERRNFPYESRKIRVKDRRVVGSTIEQCGGGRSAVFERVVRVIEAFEQGVGDIGSPSLSLWNGKIESRMGGLLSPCPLPEENSVPSQDVHSLLVCTQRNSCYKIYMFVVGRTDERAFTSTLDSTWTYTKTGLALLIFKRITWLLLALNILAFFSIDDLAVMMVVMAILNIILGTATSCFLEVKGNDPKLYINELRIKHLWADVIDEIQNESMISVKAPPLVSPRREADGDDYGELNEKERAYSQSKQRRPRSRD